MPIEKIVTLYTFDELSDKGKETAREWWRSCRDSSDFSYVIESIDQVAGMLGMAIRRQHVRLMGGGTRPEPMINWSVGYTQSDGAWLADMSYSYALGSVGKVAKEWPKDETLNDLARRLRDLQRPYMYQLTAAWKSDDRRGTSLDVDHPVRSVDGETYKALREIFKRFERWAYDYLRAEDEYQTADEQVDESIRANEYTFTADGRRED